jgi:hypothetical protein
MQHKLAFKRNARFDYMVPKPKKGASLDTHLTRPKFGTGELTGLPPKSKAYSTAKAGVCFVCEPEEVVVSHYEAGYVYEMEVQVRPPYPLLSAHGHALRPLKCRPRS